MIQDMEIIYIIASHEPLEFVPVYFITKWKQMYICWHEHNTVGGKSLGFFNYGFNQSCGRGTKNERDIVEILNIKDIKGELSRER